LCLIIISFEYFFVVRGLGGGAFSEVGQVLIGSFRFTFRQFHLSKGHQWCDGEHQLHSGTHVLLELAYHMTLQDSTFPPVEWTPLQPIPERVTDLNPSPLWSDWMVGAESTPAADSVIYLLLP